ncbi:MAG TPA: hypothetical protein VMQ76_04440 [Terracidiphilus sp.]|nr:hypothetical protein [Terracidiphilus sp.]
MRKLMGFASRAIYSAAPPERDEAYRRWIRSFPCTVCATRRGIEAAHTGAHGIGQKASDTSCIPLCRAHHAEMHRGVTAFEARYSVDVPQIVAGFNELWKARKKAA